MINQIKQYLNKASNYYVTTYFCRLIIKILKDNTPLTTYLLASRTYRKHGAPARSIQVLQKPFYSHPHNQSVVDELAESYIKINDFKRASRMLQSLLNSTNLSADPKTWQKLARCYRLMNKLDAGNEVIERGLKLYPADRSLLEEYAKIADEKEDWPKSQESWGILYAKRKSIETATKYINALSKNNNLETAMQVQKECRNIYKEINDISFLIAEAEMFNSTKDWDTAYKLWSELEKIKDNYPLSIERYIRLNVSITKRLANIEKYREKIDNYSKNKGTNKQKIKVAVYTSFTEGYDSLKPHEYIDHRLDYFVFINGEVETMGLYKHKKMPAQSQNLDGPRAIRYPKSHAHKLFPDYDIAVWIDTSIMLVDDIFPFIDDFINSGKAIATTPHSVRGSFFEEYLACIDLGKDDYTTLKKLYEKYMDEGYDSQNLSENGFLMFNIKHPDLKPAMEEWWEQITSLSKRDQLSFGYSLNKHGVEWHPITNPPINVHNNPALIISPHHTKYEPLELLVKGISNV